MFCCSKSCSGRYWVSTEAVVPIIAIKVLQLTKVSRLLWRALKMLGNSLPCHHFHSLVPSQCHLDLLIPIVAAMVEISVSLSLHYESALAG